MWKSSKLLLLVWSCRHCTTNTYHWKAGFWNSALLLTGWPSFSFALLGQSFCVAWSCLLLPSNSYFFTSLSLPMATALEFEELYLGDDYTSGTLNTFASMDNGHLCVTPYMPFRQLYRVFFLLVRPKKWLKCQITCKSLQKSSKCQNFTRVWHLVIFRADQ